MAEQAAQETGTQITDDMVSQIYSDEPIKVPAENSRSNGVNLDSVNISGQPEVKPPEEPAQPEIIAEKPKPEFDPNAYIKENFGFDNFESAKEQIERWRKAEAEPKPEQKEMQFANEDSKLLYLALQAGENDVVYNILNKQRELAKASELAPIEQIRMDLKLSHPKYSKEDIDDLIEEKYGLPEKNFDEYDDNYEDQKKVYDKQVAKIERKIKRDADVALENLQKQNQGIALSDIKQSAEQYQEFLNQQQELADWQQKAQDSYYDALEKNYSGFKGFNTAYKDKAVEVPVEYKPTEQELKDLKSRFSYGFDADDYFAKRWFDIDGDKVVGFKVADQMADIYLLENKQKIFDKIAADAAARTLDAYQRGEKNINLNSQMSGKVTGYQAAKTADDFLTEKLWQ